VNKSKMLLVNVRHLYECAMVTDGKHYVVYVRLQCHTYIKQFLKCE